MVWPWKRVLGWVVDRHGELKAAQQVPVSPAEYLTVTGQDPQLVLCLGLMAVGFAAVWLIDGKWGRTGSGGTASGRTGSGDTASGGAASGRTGSSAADQ